MAIFFVDHSQAAKCSSRLTLWVLFVLKCTYSGAGPLHMTNLHYTSDTLRCCVGFNLKFCMCRTVMLLNQQS
ncbi:hypothetical protein J6590_048513 [Homalodisca vitripennis]|nr:hypothetical protein J6590_048513 [Homalodisca vitripennis]